MTTHSFRCVGRTDRSERHVVQVRDGIPECSCQGVEWCSHIDATLLHGERFMVPADDRKEADAATRSLSNAVRAPEGWTASWRSDRVWRGLAAPRAKGVAKNRYDGRPTVCFVGQGPNGPRAEYEEQAESLGWRIVDHAEPMTTIVVADGDILVTARGRSAVGSGAPLIHHADWEEWMYDLTDAVFVRIEHHLSAGRDAA